MFLFLPSVPTEETEPMIKITTCPTCGSKKIKRVRKNETFEYKGQPYTVRGLEFEECPDCGERLYDSEAMQKIQAVSPAYAKRREKEAKSLARFLRKLAPNIQSGARR